MVRLKERAVSKYWSNFQLQICTPYDDVGTSSQKCLLFVGGFYRTFVFEIPQLFKPAYKLVTTEFGSYQQPIRRSYGFSVGEESINVTYGIQPMHWIKDNAKDSDHSACWFFPWKETALVRWQFLNPRGEVDVDVKPPFSGEDIMAARNSVKKCKFKCLDSDNQELEVICHIEEMEWARGSGAFSWMSAFTAPLVKRRLELNFNKGHGKNKNTWKGGIIADSTPIKPLETVSEAFYDYATHHGFKDVRYYGDRDRWEIS